MSDVKVSALTGADNYFEDFRVGHRVRHARGATVGEVENNFIAKQVMNTAQAHWNEHVTRNSPMGSGRLVFGLITGSLVLCLTSQDTAENAIVEVGLHGLRFVSPVHHGDTLYALTEVLSVEDSPDRDDAGLVRFKHWGVDQDDRLVFEGERTVLIKRRSHWADK